MKNRKIRLFLISAVILAFLLTLVFLLKVAKF